MATGERPVWKRRVGMHTQRVVVHTNGVETQDAAKSLDGSSGTGPDDPPRIKVAAHLAKWAKVLMKGPPLRGYLPKWAGRLMRTGPNGPTFIKVAAHLAEWAATLMGHRGLSPMTRCRVGSLGTGTRDPSVWPSPPGSGQLTATRKWRGDEKWR